MHGERLAALAAFPQPRRAVAAGAPQASALPAGTGIIDAPIESLGIEAERIRDAQRDHLAVLEGDEAAHEVGRGHRAVVAEAFEAGAGILVERPALRAVVAGRVRTAERALALAAVEAHEMAARRR